MVKILYILGVQIQIQNDNEKVTFTINNVTEAFINGFYFGIKTYIADNIDIKLDSNISLDNINFDNTYLKGIDRFNLELFEHCEHSDNYNITFRRIMKNVKIFEKYIALIMRVMIKIMALDIIN